MLYIACRSNKTAPPETEPTVIEHPKPASDRNLDSLKKTLDEQRRNRQK